MQHHLGEGVARLDDLVGPPQLLGVDRGQAAGRGGDHRAPVDEVGDPLEDPVLGDLRSWVEGHVQAS
ncbi:hypothetical protein C0Z11_00720 [Acidipropionibacterium jensenii]|uniref:hypothetical protein n=1 Tax=Acidipropionibacterium jensenii TaxID=1749 RepID=UPI000BEF13C9|nr:hypothetical protein [Acidipropionibacterium jensenii]AZZ41050.1 hypothetical protein C0Z11_00720 [Acidipropionibacterium jensenii]